jgi:hypothetical protein
MHTTLAERERSQEHRCIEGGVPGLGSGIFLHAAFERQNQAIGDIQRYVLITTHANNLILALYYDTADFVVPLPRASARLHLVDRSEGTSSTSQHQLTQTHRPSRSRVIPSNTFLASEKRRSYSECQTHPVLQRRHKPHRATSNLHGLENSTLLSEWCAWTTDCGMGDYDGVGA